MLAPPGPRGEEYQGRGANRPRRYFMEALQQDGNNAALNRHALIVGAGLCRLNGAY